MSAFIHHFAFEFRIGTRDRNLLMLNYLFPLGLYAFMGFLMIELNPAFGETLIPSMILITMLASMILGLPNPIVAPGMQGFTAATRLMACRQVRSSPSLP